MSEKTSTVRIYIMGKEYQVPFGLTIMKAMEYTGYQFVRGCGCRGGFCGACSTVYRIKGDHKLYPVLACQETVKNDMYLTQLPFTPTNKPSYELDELKPTANTLLEYYPEIVRCVSCNTCTKACPQDLEVMDYVQAGIKGDFQQIAELSFDCIACGLCAMRCPMEIAPYRMSELARRLYGKYVMPRAKHTDERVEEIEDGKYDDEMKELVEIPEDKLKERYEKRDFKI